LVIDQSDRSIEKKLTLPTRVPTAYHGQFRHIGTTKAGNILGGAHGFRQGGRIRGGRKRNLVVPAPSAWAAVRLRKWQHAAQRQHGLRFAK